jgi:hypothetical protein
MAASFLFSLVVFLLLRGLEKVGVEVEPIPMTAKYILAFHEFFYGTKLNVSSYILFQINSFSFLIHYFCVSRQCGPPGMEI